MPTLDRGRIPLVVGGGVLLGIVTFVLLGEVSVGATSSPTTADSSVPSTLTTTLPSEPPDSLLGSATPSTHTPGTRVHDSRTGDSTRRPLIIHAVGDVNFDPNYIQTFREHGYGFAFAKVEGIFESDDLSIINLECTPSTLGSPLDKEFVFRCPPDSLEIAKANGIDVVNLANNHSQDHGKTAMLDGVTQARLAGLGAVGVGVDVDYATAPFIVEVNGWKIAVLGMGGVKPSDSWVATPERSGMADGDDIGQMTESVRAASVAADLVFVSIHWGVEGESEPRDDDRARAQAMIEAGADAIFGHHPHRLGRLELVDGVPVFWTLGNFVWPKFSDQSATTGVARLEIDADGVVNACMLPAFIGAPGQPELTGSRECSP